MGRPKPIHSTPQFPAMVAKSTYQRLMRVFLLCILWIGWSSPSTAVEIQSFTEPYRDIDVAAADMGIVEAINVKEGDRVEKGQLLARIDASVLEATLHIAESIKESRGQLESATAELELKTTMLAKLETLHTRQHASRQEIERARNQKRIAEAHLQAVREELKVKTLEYQRTQVELERRRVRSPIDGVVTQIFKDRGETVLLNEPVLLKVVQLDSLLAIFLVPAAEARCLQRRKSIDVRIAGVPTRVRGDIEFVSPLADPQSGLTRVRVRIANPEERLPCGATCYLQLDD